MTDSWSLLKDEKLAGMLAELRSAADSFAPATVSAGPIHTVYGGAHLFKRTSFARLAEMAWNSFSSYAPDPATLTKVFGLRPDIAELIHPLIADRLKNRAIEDFRIDFEDGYGLRSEEEEDRHAEAAAAEAKEASSNGDLPPYFGIRVRPLGPLTAGRSFRTLQIFLAVFGPSIKACLAGQFLVTIPKVTSVRQVEVACSFLEGVENEAGIDPGRIGLELMVESPSPLLSEAGLSIREMIAAARGRCNSVHFGAFDYLAYCGIPARQQDLGHPLCNHARSELITRLSGTGVRLVDGVTTFIPIEPHRGAGARTESELRENQAAVWKAWEAHYVNVTRSLESGVYQSWDLHPAQIPARLVALYNFFHDGIELSAERLRNFIEKATRATTVGTVFDDAASAQGLLNHFYRAVSAGAIGEEDVKTQTGLSFDEIKCGSFSAILQKRRDGADATRNKY